MHFFRSKPMGKYDIVLLRDNAFSCLVQLGILGKAQFTHDGDDYAPCGAFMSEVIRCNTLLTIFTMMEAYLEENKLKPTFHPNVDEEHIPKENDLGRIEQEVSAANEELQSFIHYDINLHRKLEELLEEAEVLEKVDEFLGGMTTEGSMLVWTDLLANQMKDGEAVQKSEQILNFFIGTMPTEWFFGFERMIHRLTRGSHIMKSSQIEVVEYVPLKEDRKIRKTVFMICFLGQPMGTRIYKVITAYHATLYNVPDTSGERKARRKSCIDECTDLVMVLKLGSAQRQVLINAVKENLFIWKTIIKKTMIVYVELNKFEIERGATTQYLKAACWVPKAYDKAVQKALAEGSLKSTNTDSTVGTPLPFFSKQKVILDDDIPTEFDLNSFTRVFQNLINAYGMASYNELNPAPYTIITFPFLFAVMFGDFGHGLIMVIFGMILIRKYKKYVEESRKSKSIKEISDILFGGRYVILLMGIFSCYTGLLYNDCFSKSLNIMGSHWRVNFNKTEVMQIEAKVPLDPSSGKNYIGNPYYFGFDPIWKVAGDESIVVFNSIKMKLAIILGVFHMLFGLFLSAQNNVYFRNTVDLLLITVPQIIIFSSLFVYLAFMIFYKWTFYGGHYETPYSSGCAPSILIIFINMFLMKQNEAASNDCNALLFTGQDILQYILVSMALCCVPILLAGKPIYFYLNKRRIKKMKGKREKKQSLDKLVLDVRKSLIYQLEYNTSSHVSWDRSAPVAHKTIDMLEVWIHSGIHTIDSVLGAISHTASYLRLWALSLAHEQLSTVLWNMILQKSFVCDFGYLGSIMIVVCFAIWALLTVSILVTMEGLSAFLHCLRLHWVEFQSKFYDGTGIAFQPFKFEKSSMKI